MARRRNSHRYPCHQNGWLLVEVLVALLILAIGLIGLARLQAASLQFSHGAWMRTQATNLANDMTDRLRANRRDAIAAGNPYNLGVGDATPGTDTLANTDLNEWRNTLAATLPEGTGSVNVADDGETTIIVCWDDTRGGAPQGAPAACAAVGLMGFRFETRL